VNQTGAWNPENLEILAKGRETINNNIDVYMPQKLKNLEQGRETQKKLKINLGNPEHHEVMYTQRLKSLQYWGVEINGRRYSIDKEQRCYLCETTLDYYLKFAPSRQKKEKE
jgi:hypothetical protein